MADFKMEPTVIYYNQFGVIRDPNHEFILWGNKNPGEHNSCYSDRLYQLNPLRFNELCLKHFGDEGQYFDSREIAAIQSFLCDFIGFPVELVRIVQHTNKSNGYPYWRFDYKEIEQ